jgi:hypothetical protein
MLPVTFARFAAGWVWGADHRVVDRHSGVRPAHLGTKRLGLGRSGASALDLVGFPRELLRCGEFFLV